MLDLYFMDARSRLIELAAFMDRVERAEGGGVEDFRWESFRRALGELGAGGVGGGRAEAVLRSLSDPTEEPVAAASGKGAMGAWPGERVGKG